MENKLMTIKKLKDLLNRYDSNALLYIFSNNIRDVAYLEKENKKIFVIYYSLFNKETITIKKILKYITKNNVDDDVEIVGFNYLAHSFVSFDKANLIIEGNINLC